MPKAAPLSQHVLFADLLARFVLASRESSVLSAQERATTHASFAALITGFAEASADWQRAQKAAADDFNVLDVVNLTDSENHHSMVLAWLLDARITDQGTHAQGNLGFRLFLKQFQKHGLRPSYADADYKVSREQAGRVSNSRIDIRIEAPGLFIIDIESKVWASEGEGQTQAEWDDLLDRARQLQVPASGVHAFFLTRDRAPAQCREFVSISWAEIALVAEAFAAQAEAPLVKLFAGHYADVLRRRIMAPPVCEESADEADIQLP